VGATTGNDYLQLSDGYVRLCSTC